MVASAGSKNQHVKYGIIDDNCDGAKLDICPDLLIAGLALFGAAAFAAVYTAITMAASRRRRKRTLDQPIDWVRALWDFYWIGIVVRVRVFVVPRESHLSHCVTRI